MYLFKALYPVIPQLGYVLEQNKLLGCVLYTSNSFFPFILDPSSSVYQPQTITTNLSCSYCCLFYYSQSSININVHQLLNKLHYLSFVMYACQAPIVPYLPCYIAESPVSRLSMGMKTALSLCHTHNHAARYTCNLDTPAPFPSRTQYALCLNNN